MNKLEKSLTVMLVSFILAFLYVIISLALKTEEYNSLKERYNSLEKVNSKLIDKIHIK